MKRSGGVEEGAYSWTMGGVHNPLPWIRFCVELRMDGRMKRSYLLKGRASLPVFPHSSSSNEIG